MNEPSLEPAFIGEGTRGFQRRFREVDAGDYCPFARPG